jgi:hypothetical protein
VRKSWGQFKPPIGTQLETGDPLSNRLVAALLWDAAGSGCNAVNNVIGTTYNEDSSYTWNVTPYGAGRAITAAHYGQNGEKHALPRGVDRGLPFTLAGILMNDSAGGNTLLSCNMATQSNGPKIEANGDVFYLNNGGSYHVDTTGFTVIGKYYVIHAVMGGPDANYALYINGILIDTAATASPGSAVYTEINVMAGESNADLSRVSAVAGAWVWDRALRPAEIARHAVDPWAMFAPRRTLEWFGTTEAAPTANRRRRFLTAAG